MVHMPKSGFVPNPILFGKELLVVAICTSLGGKQSLVLVTCGFLVYFVVIVGEQNLSCTACRTQAG